MHDRSTYSMRRRRFVAGASCLIATAILAAASTAPRCACGAEPDSSATRLAAVAAGAFAAHAPHASLGPTTAVPWNPPAPLQPRRTWERALLMPGRLATFPLSALGAVADRTLLWVEDSGRMSGRPMAKSSTDRGLHLGFAKLGDRTGLGGVAELRTPIMGGALRSDLSARYTQTLTSYNSTRVTWSGRPLALQYGYDWRPQDRFFGVGLETPYGGRTVYASQGEFVLGMFSIARGRVVETAMPSNLFTLWAGPRSMVTRTGRESGEVSFEQYYPEIAGTTLDHRVEHLVYGASFAADRRTGSPAPIKGWRAQVSAERFDAPIQALALHTARTDGALFTRYQAEAEVGVSFMRDPRTLRLRTRVMDQSVDANQGRLLISDMATLGGRPGLRGFSPGRFHDLDLLHTVLSYAFPISRRLEIDLHSEWGGVYRDVWRDARLGGLKNSVGLSVRGKPGIGMRGSLGVDFSAESTRLHYSLGTIE